MNKIYKKCIEEMIKELEEKGEVIPATNDYIFKALFQDKEMRGILSFVISEVTGIDKEYIFEHLVFRNSEIPKRNITEKANTNDLVVDIENTTISLEMNSNNGLDTKFRNSAHYHSLIVDSIKQADTYKDAKIIIQINFDNKRPFSKELISEIMLMDVLTGKIDEENYKKYRINLSKVRQKDYNKSEITRFERILLVMQEKDKEKLRSLAGEDKEIKKMEEKIEKMSKSPRYVSLYDEEKLYKLSLSIAEHEMKKEAARQGLEEGMKQGIEKGIEQGTYQNKIEIAKNMLNEKMDIQIISKVTGLTKNELEELIS